MVGIALQSEGDEGRWFAMFQYKRANLTGPAQFREGF